MLYCIGYVILCYVIYYIGVYYVMLYRITVLHYIFICVSQAPHRLRLRHRPHRSRGVEVARGRAQLAAWR